MYSLYKGECQRAESEKLGKLKTVYKKLALANLFNINKLQYFFNVTYTFIPKVFVGFLMRI